MTEPRKPSRPSPTLVTGREPWREPVKPDPVILRPTTDWGRDGEPESPLGWALFLLVIFATGVLVGFGLAGLVW